MIRNRLIAVALAASLIFGSVPPAPAVSSGSPSHHGASLIAGTGFSSQALSLRALYGHDAGLRELRVEMIDKLTFALSEAQNGNIDSGFWGVIEILGLLRDNPRLGLDEGTLEVVLSVIEKYHAYHHGRFVFATLSKPPVIRVSRFLDMLKNYRMARDFPRLIDDLNVIHPRLRDDRHPELDELLSRHFHLPLSRIASLTDEQYRRAVRHAHDNVTHLQLYLADDPLLQPVMKSLLLRGIHTTNSQRGGPGTSEPGRTWFKVLDLSEANKTAMQRASYLLDHFQPVLEEDPYAGHQIYQIGFQRNADESMQAVAGRWNDVLAQLEPQGPSLVAGVPYSAPEPTAPSEPLRLWVQCMRPFSAFVFLAHSTVRPGAFHLEGADIPAELRNQEFTYLSEGVVNVVYASKDWVIKRRRSLREGTAVILTLYLEKAISIMLPSFLEKPLSDLLWNPRSWLNRTALLAFWSSTFFVPVSLLVDSPPGRMWTEMYELDQSGERLMRKLPAHAAYIPGYLMFLPLSFRADPGWLGAITVEAAYERIQPTVEELLRSMEKRGDETSLAHWMYELNVFVNEVLADEGLGYSDGHPKNVALRDGQFVVLDSGGLFSKNGKARSLAAVPRKTAKAWWRTEEGRLSWLRTHLERWVEDDRADGVLSDKDAAKILGILSTDQRSILALLNLLALHLSLELVLRPATVFMGPFFFFLAALMLDNWPGALYGLSIMLVRPMVTLVYAGQNKHLTKPATLTALSAVPYIGLGATIFRLLQREPVLGDYLFSAALRRKIKNPVWSERLSRHMRLWVIAPAFYLPLVLALGVGGHIVGQFGWMSRWIFWVSGATLYAGIILGEAINNLEFVKVGRRLSAGRRDFGLGAAS